MNSSVLCLDLKLLTILSKRHNSEPEGQWHSRTQCFDYGYIKLSAYINSNRLVVECLYEKY